MITRRLLAFLTPSLLAAQEHWSEVGTLPVKRTPRIPRPRNGECPVCGTMAVEPYKPDIREYSGMCLPCTEATCHSICRPFTEADLPKSRRIDCHHCGCTFRQWAEGKEPKR